ncbi:MAG: OmpH family outer membrane protein [Rhabdochlamydiaceae bacterium]|jgi:Skp family chaperone for outer membrane proteins
MKKTLLVLLTMASSLCAADVVPKLGVVDFDTCATESKMGKEESTSFSTLQSQAMADMQSMEKERQELAKKLNDQDYLDGLSPEEQTELNQKMQNQQMKMQLAGENYEKTLRQTYQNMEEKLSASIKTASESVAKEKKLEMVIPSRLCIYSLPTLNVTAEVIKKMDESAEKATKEQAGLKK